MVREAITRVVHGEPDWQFSTDYGVVFELTRGAVVVAKASHYVESLIAHVADGPGAIDIDDRSIEWDWDNEPGEEYRVRRDRIPIGRLLSPGGISEAHEMRLPHTL